MATAAARHILVASEQECLDIKQQIKTSKGEIKALEADIQ